MVNILQQLILNGNKWLFAKSQIYLSVLRINENDIRKLQTDEVVTLKQRSLRCFQHAVKIIF